MVVAASTTPNLKATPSVRPSHSNPRRPQLLPSERDNNAAAAAVAPHRRPKSREVNSRYLSASSSTSTSGSSSSTLSNSSYYSSSHRCPSPIPARMPTPAPNLSAIVRSQSAERGRPGTPRLITPRIGGEISAAAKPLVSSTRRLSVSFQGESFAVPKSKKTLKSAPSPRTDRPAATAAVTPRKGGKQGENARPPFEHHHPWSGRSRAGVTSSLSRSIDFGCSGKKLINGSAKVVRALQESLNGGDSKGSRTSSDNDKLQRRSLTRGGASVKEWDAGDASCCINGSSLGADSIVSDTESAPSECNSVSLGSSTCSSAARSKGGGRSIVFPPRFWQEAKSRLTRASEPGSPSPMGTLKGLLPLRLNAPKKLVHDSPGVSPRGTITSKGFSSPLCGSMRPESPSKLRPSVVSEKCYPSRVLASPSKVRNATQLVFAQSVTSTPSILSFGADVRRVKVGDNRLGNAHLLRLLHNRHLQWRIVNARAHASLFRQKTHAEVQDAYLML